jgi:hypothetical protein
MPMETVSEARGLRPPDVFRIDELVRFEGDSDPGDESAVFARTSKADSTTGTYTVAYGPMMDAIDVDIVDRLRSLPSSAPEDGRERVRKRALADVTSVRLAAAARGAPMPVLRLAPIQHLKRRVAGIVDGPGRCAEQGGEAETERCDDRERRKEVSGSLHGCVLRLELDRWTVT